MASGTDRGKPYSYYSDRGIATLNTRIRGKRIRESLAIQYDPDTASPRLCREIETAAAKKYADLIAGRTVKADPGARVLTTATLEELGGLWLMEAEKLWPKGIKTRVIQLGNAIAWATDARRFTADKRTPLERIVADMGPTQYATDRLTSVLKDTVSKEVSNLFAFLRWAVDAGHLASPPLPAKYPRGALGKRSGTQREEPVDITDTEALAICAALPEWAVRGGRGIVPGQPPPPKAFRVRDVCRLSYELALRPSDVQRIAMDRHWRHGQTYIQFTADIQKTGEKVRLELTEVAVEILERCAPESGLIFGRHSLRNHLKAAAAKVLPPEKARDFSAYDFRHGRAVHALETTGDLIGTQALLRHARATTTNRYLRVRESHATKMIKALDAVRDRSGAVSGDLPMCTTLPSHITAESFIKVRRRGLEPLRLAALAPQGTSRDAFCALATGLECQSASVDPAFVAWNVCGRSGGGQEEKFRPLRKAVIGLSDLRAAEASLEAWFFANREVGS